MVYTINLQEKALTSKERNKLDDKEFGIPEERKYPLNDEAHVRAAVKFFNKVEPKYEESLARRIIRRIKELDLDINVGEDNKLSKYYKSPKKESTVLVESYKNPIILKESFVDIYYVEEALKSILPIIEKEMSKIKEYDLYNPKTVDFYLSEYKNKKNNKKIIIEIDSGEHPDEFLDWVNNNQEKYKKLEESTKEAVSKINNNETVKKYGTFSFKNNGDVSEYTYYFKLK